jgi:hypothetical protein
MLRRLLDENIEMTVVYGDNIGTIKADSGYVWQVLMNLEVNARDAMPDGGKLVIQTSAAQLDGVYPQAQPGTTPGPTASGEITMTVGMRSTTILSTIELDARRLAVNIAIGSLRIENMVVDERSPPHIRALCLGGLSLDQMNAEISTSTATIM